MCGSKKYHTTPTEGHLKFLGERFLKAKLLEEKYDEAKLEFPVGGGGRDCAKQNNFPWEKYGYYYFLKLHVPDANKVCVCVCWGGGRGVTMAISQRSPPPSGTWQTDLIGE